MMYYLDILGTIIFAVTGSLAAGRKHLDVFGVVVVSLATALGGGTLRDVALGSLPVFWVSDPLYIIVTGVASLATFAVARFHRLPDGLLRVADAFGLAVFTVIGAERALAAGASYLVAVLMGMVTGVAGGMIRDMLSGEVPLILRREIYATASLCGAAACVGLAAVCPEWCAGTVVGAAVTLGLRLAAIQWDLSLPQFFPKGMSDAGR
ncbi:MAG: trimeric intracellular cation channel family protein [Planctomycetota bacterium]|nr:trimeric intracellular cation channel family protein [Planctomycetota bacterium]